jgi:hypothetical protein
MLIQNRNPKFRPLCLLVLTFHEYEGRFVLGFHEYEGRFVLGFHEYEGRFVLGFRLDYSVPVNLFFCFCVKLFCILFMCYNQYKLNNSSDPR